MANELTKWFARASARAKAKAETKVDDPPGMLAPEFYARGTSQVSRELLGKILIVRSKASASLVAGRIVETEAYLRNDPASHAFRGRTLRNASMFGEPGHAYVYFIYGFYEMLNFVTEPAGHPGAVLIRAIEPVWGEEKMRSNRPKARSRRELTDGPGKLCRAFGIARSDDGASLFGPRLFVVDDGFRPERVLASPRVGITQGTEYMGRFYIADNEFVSRAPQNRLAKVLRGKGAA